ncbi:MAG: exonuclease SbcCD subunit D C-terminal domain-containing protein [Planctomycetota bacterium]
MRVLHTSDWHLGHSLHGLDRAGEHAAFLGWLLDTLVVERVDALLITGDVYDSACPPIAAERALFDFLADARRRLPGLEVVLIGGNHDSAQRLDASAALLRAIGVHVVGALPISTRGAELKEALDWPALDWERLLVPLRGPGGEVEAQVVALPFLRPADLPPNAPDPTGAGRESALIASARRLLEAVFAGARARRVAGAALLATGHCTIRGASLSALSERAIHGGDALPVDLFPEDLAYVALGHLHRAQAVGGREAVRYAGSPLPLSFAEVDYRHEVRLLELAGERLVAQRGLAVPRSVELVRILPAPLPEVLAALAALPPRVVGEPAARRPFLEVRVEVPRAGVLGPQPSSELRRAVEEALADKRARLVKLELLRDASGETLADHEAGSRLGELDPREVFRRCWERDHEGPPPRELRGAFEELLLEVGGARSRASQQEPVADEAAVEDPVADELVADELVADELVADELVADELVADELVADELGAGELGAGELGAGGGSRAELAGPRAEQGGPR